MPFSTAQVENFLKKTPDTCGTKLHNDVFEGPNLFGRTKSYSISVSFVTAESNKWDSFNKNAYLRKKSK